MSPNTSTSVISIQPIRKTHPLHLIQQLLTYIFLFLQSTHWSFLITSIIMEEASVVPQISLILWTGSRLYIYHIFFSGSWTEFFMFLLILKMNHNCPFYSFVLPFGILQSTMVIKSTSHFLMSDNVDSIEVARASEEALKHSIGFIK